MPVAVISDIQGKIAALDAVLANLSARTMRGSRNGPGAPRRGQWSRRLGPPLLEGLHPL